MEKLNKGLREEERIFKLKEAIQNKNQSFTIELLVNSATYDLMLNTELKGKVENIVRDILPSDIKFTINYIKTVTENKYVLKCIMDFLYYNAPTVYPNLQNALYDIEIKSDIIIVNITLEKYLYCYMEESGLHEKIADHISRCFMEEGQVNIIEIPNTDSIETTSVTITPNSIRIIDIDVIKSYTGTIAHNPRYIIDVVSSEFKSLTVCGVVANVKARYIEKINKTLYSFYLYDTTGNISVKYFARTVKKVNWEDAIKDGETLVVTGEYRMDSYDNKLVLMARSISKCAIKYNSIDIKSDFYKESECYICVFPEKFSDAIQYDLFTKKTTLSKELEDKIYVVFDLETTGADMTKDRIMEIGAVKIIKGKIVESFHCLINPEMPISKGALEVHGITSEMVEDEPIFKDVAGDFYKFTRNSILVAHNAPFDIGILTRQGVEEKYDFNNPFVDTLTMSRQKLTLNKFNLVHICKALNIPYEGAHRALNDAIAAAKLFLKLIEIKNI